MSQPAAPRRGKLALGAGAAVLALAAATTLIFLAAPSAIVVGAAAVPSERDREYAVLHARTDADAAAVQYERFLADARDTMSDQRNWGPWQRKDSSGNTARCTGEFPATEYDDATQATLPLWYTPAPALDPQHWRAARDLVIDVGRRYGFTPGPTRSDVPGNYVLTLTAAADGAFAEFGVGQNAVLSVLTGCHLTPEAHRRGTPAPTTVPSAWRTR